MKYRSWPFLCAPAAVLLLAASNGAWLKRVPAADHTRVNPLAGHSDAVAAGSTLYQDNCAKCHGVDGNGRGSRPSLHSARIAAATDGDLFWLLTRGQPFRGMPAWARLSEDQRWQIVAYLRTIQPPANTDAKE
jgi:mono/diheme cytochrome c family protein